jgi:hypothetical protein
MVLLFTLPAVANECEDGCMLVHARGVAGQSPMGKTVWWGVALPSAASMHMLFSQRHYHQRTLQVATTQQPIFKSVW